ncbi:PREDICTED: zinc finger MYM-type protein 1-like [Nicotiana attenuata]|uniref:zinc finger MYM-type protein 1-like n=1 Tax=Nicotiana attenuata TaxID=49451 RepID=UPI000905518E|nr:PREDICTED: zinc finger MYM-type protein 1-like [Nicotiana attenuata]
MQKDTVSVGAQETMKAIINDLDGDYFEILVYESKDISHHEQMDLVLRFVDKKCQMNKPFIGLVRVGDTSAKSLKEEILSLLMKHTLSPSKIRGQGYDGASNMQGKMNDLKALILQETPSAHCIHCFAHQLQLRLVAELNSRFDVVSSNLLLGTASLNPANSFANLDKERIMTLAKDYPDEFGELKLRDLSTNLTLSYCT